MKSPLWTLLKDKTEDLVFDDFSLKQVDYSEEEAARILKEAKDYILAIYHTGFGPNYQTNQYESYDNSHYMRIRRGQIVVYERRFHGVYYKNSDMHLSGILFVEGGHEGRLSDSGGYSGSIIPESRYSAFVVLAHYPGDYLLPKGYPSRETEGLEIIPSDLDKKDSK